MRDRLRARERAMARRPGERELNLSPRARRVTGWVAAAGLVIGIAIGVRLVGGTGDGSPGAVASASAAAAEVGGITFGTALDPATGLVATPARTTRFGADEPFAYSAGVAPQPTVFVEVERLTADGSEVVQERAAQTLPAGAVTTAFEVPAAVLHEAFGPGDYRMRIYLAAADEHPAAEGTFVLEPTSASPAASG